MGGLQGGLKVRTCVFDRVCIYLNVCVRVRVVRVRA